MAYRDIESPLELVCPITDTSDDARLSVEALKILGLARDQDQLFEFLKHNYNYIKTSQGEKIGELFVHLPLKQLKIDPVDLISVVDVEGAKKDYPKTDFHDMFAHSSRKADYTNRYLGKLSFSDNNSTIPYKARGVILNDKGKLLHFVDQMYYLKDQDPKDDTPTQMGSLKTAKEEFENANYGLSLDALDASDIAILSLQHIIKGQPSVLSNEFLMRVLDFTWDRKNKSAIAYSIKKQLCFRESSGLANPCVGIGLSAGTGDLKSKLAYYALF